MKNLLKLFIPLLSLIAVSTVLAGNGLNTSNGIDLMPGVTEISQRIFSLHQIIFYICVVIAVGVFSAMGYSIYAHRKSKNPTPATFHENTLIEIAWTIIPFGILVAIAVPATQFMIDREDVSKADMSIKVTGSQWKWRYDYVDGAAEGIGFVSSLDEISQEQSRLSTEKGVVPSYEYYNADVDNRLVIPTGKRVRFLITATDVLHSWWVPDFGVKQDAVPGFINATWAEVPVGQEGVYRGVCTELCGRGHAYMPVVVQAVSQADFEAWVEEKRNADKKESQSANKVWTMGDLVSRGEKVYNTNCAACHMAGGVGLAGMFPAIVGSKVAIGSQKGHIDIILNGKNLMPAFRDVLSDVDFAAVVTYQRNGLNKVGDLVQPAQIKAAR